MPLAVVSQLIKLPPGVIAPSTEAPVKLPTLLGLLHITVPALPILPLALEKVKLLVPFLNVNV